MLVSKTDVNSKDHNDVYRPPKFAPTSMEEDKGGLKRLVVAYFYRGNRHDGWIYCSRNCFLLIFIDCIELARYRAKRDERERQEEVLFTRAPITKKEKQREKHLKKSRNGLLGLTDNFYVEIKGLPLDDENDEQVASFSSARGGMGRHKKHKNLEVVQNDMCI
ncbi:hypothetical protein ACFX13_020141 [Malus domestica]